MATKLDNLTLALEGEVTLDDFNKAVSALKGLLASLGTAVGVGNGDVTWVISGLEYGSAAATVTGHSNNPAHVVSVVEGYTVVGRSLAAGNSPPYSPQVRRYAGQLGALLGGDVEAIRFGTPATDIIMRSKAVDIEADPSTEESFGAIEGRIQTLSSRGRLRFTLYDSLDDKAVTCYLDPGQDDQLADLWSRLAIVEGAVTRDAFTGKPISIRGITHIRALPEPTADSYRSARGVLTGILKEPSDLAVRKLRDAW